MAPCGIACRAAAESRMPLYRAAALQPQDEMRDEDDPLPLFPVGSAADEVERGAEDRAHAAKAERCRSSAMHA